MPSSLLSFYQNFANVFKYFAYTISLHEDYIAENYLQLVDHDIVKNLMEEIGGKDLIHFVDSEYSAAI